MISFFRKIRKSLFLSGSVNKYLLYALGEIALVVVGILIALQINNWNENRKNRSLETILLKEIHNEFSYNLEELESTLSTYRKGFDNLRKIDKLWPIATSDTSIDSFAKLFISTNLFHNADLSMVSLEKLKSTSTLNIISNTDLKNLLLKFEVLTSDYKQTEQEYLDYHNQIYIPKMNEEIIYPHDKGIELKSKDDLFLNSVPFKNLVRYKSGKMSQFFRMTEWADGDENIIDVLNKIITLSSSGDT